MNVEVNPEALAELKSKLTLKNATKVIFGTFISLGAAAAIVMALKDPLKASKGILKILMLAGVLVLADKAGDIAEEHFKEKVDDWAEVIDDIRKETKEEGDEQHGTDSHAGRNTQQQPEKQGAEGNSTGKAADPPVRWRWWSQKERARKVLEVDAKDVSERQEPEGHHEGCSREPDRSGN